MTVVGLKIGNYISIYSETPDAKIVKIIGIPDDKEVITDDRKESHSLLVCDGVTLTEKLIKSFGFKRLPNEITFSEQHSYHLNKNYKIYAKDGIVFQYDIKTKEFFYEIAHDGLIDYRVAYLKFVHDLQNIWIIFTQTELKINL